MFVIYQAHVSNGFIWRERKTGNTVRGININANLASGYVMAYLKYGNNRKFGPMLWSRLGLTTGQEVI